MPPRLSSPLVAGSFFAAFIALAGVPVAAQSDLEVRIRLYDAVAPESLRTPAKAAASMVMREAGIKVGWRDCSDPDDLAPGCDEPPDGEFIIRFVDSPDTADLATLGYSLVDGSGRGYQATVFVDRVRSLATRGQMDAGRLLGLTTAHEIVHMVLGHSAHAPGGLLRALWTVEEVDADVASHWRLSSAEGDELRRIMLARLQTRDDRILTAQRQGPGRPSITP